MKLSVSLSKFQTMKRILKVGEVLREGEGEDREEEEEEEDEGEKLKAEAATEEGGKKKSGEEEEKERKEKEKEEEEERESLVRFDEIAWEVRDVIVTFRCSAYYELGPGSGLSLYFDIPVF